MLGAASNAYTGGSNEVIQRDIAAPSGALDVILELAFFPTEIADTGTELAGGRLYRPPVAALLALMRALRRTMG